MLPTLVLRPSTDLPVNEQPSRIQPRLIQPPPILPVAESSAQTTAAPRGRHRRRAALGRREQLGLCG